MEGIQTFKGSWPWPSIRPYGIPSCITHRPLTIYQISFKSKKLFVDGRTFFPLILLRRLLEVNLINGGVICLSWLILNCNEWLIHYITFLTILMGISALVRYYKIRYWIGSEPQKHKLHKLITTGSDRSTLCWFVRTLKSSVNSNVV